MTTPRNKSGKVTFLVSTFPMYNKLKFSDNVEAEVVGFL